MSRSLAVTIGCIVCCAALVGCTGKLATSGWASVAQLAPNGAMLLQYKDGEAKWKLLKQDNIHSEFKTAAKNLGAPARFVETKVGSVLTFPNGDSVHYRDIPKE